MSFNPDPSKPAQEYIFRRKTKRLTHPPLVFNNNISRSFSQKHLGVILDFRLILEDHLNNVLAKVNKTEGLQRKLRSSLPKTNINYYTQIFHSTTFRLW